MNIIRTLGNGGRSEAALGPGRSRGGFPKIFPFFMEVLALSAFFGFRDGAFGFAPVLVSATVPGHLSPSAPQELQDH